MEAAENPPLGRAKVAPGISLTTLRHKKATLALLTMMEVGVLSGLCLTSAGNAGSLGCKGKHCESPILLWSLVAVAIALLCSLAAYVAWPSQFLAISRWIGFITMASFPLPWWFEGVGGRSASTMLFAPGQCFVQTGILLLAISGSCSHHLVMVLTVVHAACIGTLNLYDFIHDECKFLGEHAQLSCGGLYFQTTISTIMSNLMSAVLVMVLLQRLEHEQIVADALVNNCLPSSVSTEYKMQISNAIIEAAHHEDQALVRTHLKEQPALIGLHVSSAATTHHGVTILFADICHFTQAAGTVAPCQVVETLCKVFQDIDWMCIAHGVEKIKTIGDAYMACGNLRPGAADCDELVVKREVHSSPIRSDKTDCEVNINMLESEDQGIDGFMAGSPSEPSALRSQDSAISFQEERHCEKEQAGALAALEVAILISHMSGYYIGQNEIIFRVGLHTGSIVSGVIGLTRFCFDVWGDAVNVASRMESTCPQSRVQVSSSTYELTRGRYKFIPRGPIKVRGKCPMLAYLVSDEGAVSSMGERTTHISSASPSQGSGFSGSSVSTLTSPLSEKFLPSRATSLNPLLVGPSFFTRSSVASSIAPSPSGASHKSQSTVRDREKKRPQPIELRVEQSLAEDFESMMSPKGAPTVSIEVDNWLSSLGLAKYLDVFVEHQWPTLQSLAYLQPEDLDAMQITAVGARRTILTAAGKLQQKLNNAKSSVAAVSFTDEEEKAEEVPNTTTASASSSTSGDDDVRLHSV